MNDTILKLINYKGAIAANWRVPRTRRQIVANAKKLIKFYYRCKDAKFLTPEVLTALKTYASALQDLAFLVLQAFSKHPHLVEVLDEIRNTEVSELKAEVVEEKMRQHEKQICSICHVTLVYPAYIVWRQGDEIVDRSLPIGIMCLNNRVKKLNDLTVAVQVEVDTRRQALQAPAVPAA
jgi:hypothetical protein